MRSVLICSWLAGCQSTALLQQAPPAGPAPSLADPVDTSTDRWRKGTCRDDFAGIEGTVEIGSVVSDFSLTDQHGDVLHLSDFCDRQVVLVSTALWCGACRTSAPRLEALYQEYADAGFIVITLVGQDVDFLPATHDDVRAWASTFGLTHPVVLDTDFAVTQRFTGAGQVELPSMHQLGPGLELLARDTLVSEDDVRGALP